ncbi:MAG TPA: 5-formyltetrahydrofolate cyclo-ligase [Micromonosporaceae bacterium]|nr:5-formyltetrahydrofolate cyclo-ligase [Micromonosporaceae bacterium]
MLAQWADFNHRSGPRPLSVFVVDVRGVEIMTGEPKRDLRLRVLDARRAMSEAVRADHDRRLCHAAGRWLDSLPAGAATTIAAYVPMPNEPGGPDLPASLAPHVQRVLLPIWRDDNDLDWAAYEGDLEPAGRRPHEPRGPRLGVDAIGDADVLLIPALAVDHDGMRLGRGGGSYDRALTRLGPNTVALALVYPDEILTEPVPAEPHDRRVHGALTLDGVHWFGGSAAL